MLTKQNKTNAHFYALFTLVATQINRYLTK